MKMILFSFIFALVMGTGCSEKTDSVEAAKKEVMDLHDEVMPKMGELRTLRKDLQAKSQEADSLVAIEFEMTANDLKEANESMMDWMNQFEPQFEGTEKDKIKYYSDQKISIQKVKTRMLNALEKGQKALAE